MKTDKNNQRKTTYLGYNLIDFRTLCTNNYNIKDINTKAKVIDFKDIETSDNSNNASDDDTSTTEEQNASNVQNTN